jgi:hypothetical protein
MISNIFLFPLIKIYFNYVTSYFSFFFFLHCAEAGLLDGAAGTVKAIVYKHKEEPRGKGALPAYVVVDIPHSRIPDHEKLIPDKPATLILAPVNCFNYEYSC